MLVLWEKMANMVVLWEKKMVRYDELIYVMKIYCSSFTHKSGRLPTRRASTTKYMGFMSKKIVRTKFNGRVRPRTIAA